MVFSLCCLSLESLVVPGDEFKPVLRLTHGPVPFHIFQACDSGLCSDLRPCMTWISGFKQAQNQSWSLQSIYPDEHITPRLQSQHIPELCCHLCCFQAPNLGYLRRDELCDSDFLHSRKKPKPTLFIPNLLVKACRITEGMGLEVTL